MFVNKITFENGVSVFLPAMPSEKAAELLKTKIISQNNVEIGAKGQSLRETMQSIQTIGGFIMHKFIDSGDVYSVGVNQNSLLHRFVKESNET
jgi:hypothetical protein